MGSLKRCEVMRAVVCSVEPCSSQGQVQIANDRRRKSNELMSVAMLNSVGGETNLTRAGSEGNVRRGELVGTNVRGEGTLSRIEREYL